MYFVLFHFQDNTFMQNVFITSHNIVPLYFLPNKQNSIFLHPVKSEPAFTASKKYLLHNYHNIRHLY